MEEEIFGFFFFYPGKPVFKLVFFFEEAPYSMNPGAASTLRKKYWCLAWISLILK